MKLFGIATLASGALANLYSEYQSLNSNWAGFNFNGKNAMTETRKAQLALSEDEQCMWDELKYMKDVYYAPLFCTPWGWNNGASWQNLWRGYMEHWKHFEASYYRNGVTSFLKYYMKIFLNFFLSKSFEKKVFQFFKVSKIFQNQFCHFQKQPHDLPDTKGEEGS